MLTELAALYLIHCANFVLPLITTPFLTRVLGPGSWGLLAFFQAFGQILILVIEYGFGFSATRDLARNRGSCKFRSSTLEGVFGGKLIVLTGTMVITLFCWRFVPIFRDHGLLLLCGSLMGATGGLNLNWYFQGIGRIRLQAGIETSARALSTVLICWLVRSPADNWIPLAVFALSYLISVVLGLSIACRDTPILKPSFAGGVAALRNGFPFFIYRASVSACTAGNGIVLGFSAPPTVLGYYAGAERVIRALLGLFQPLSQFLYATLNHTMANSARDARRIHRLGAATFVSVSLLLSIGVWAAAPLIVKLLLGSRFSASVPALKVLSLLLPLAAITNSLGLQWMVPLGFDKAFTRIAVAAAIADVVLAISLSHPFQALGVCWAVVLSELAAALLCFGFLRRQGLMSLSSAPGAVTVPSGTPPPQYKPLKFNGRARENHENCCNL